MTESLFLWVIQKVQGDIPCYLIYSTSWPSSMQCTFPSCANCSPSVLWVLLCTPPSLPRCWDLGF